MVADDNVKQAVPFFRVADMAESLRYYVDGLGFHMTNKWYDRGALRWCWLELGGAALMLQEADTSAHHAPVPRSPLGEGVTICFICEDALEFYRTVSARGIEASTPMVGNRMWVTSLRDPDGYRLEFESLTDTPEETVYGGDAA